MRLCRNASKRLSLVIVLSSTLFFAAFVSPGAVSHVGAPAETRAIEYLQSCFAKPVVWVDGLKNLDPTVLPACAQGDEKLQKAVAAALEQKGFRLVSGQDVLVFMSAAVASRPQPWMLAPPNWSGGAKLTLDLKNYIPRDSDASWPDVYKKLPLTDSQMQSFAKQILQDTRLIRIIRPGSVVNPAIISDPKLREEALHPPNYIPVDLRIVFDARQFSPSSPESIIAVLSERTSSRLIYGEIKNGRYDILWDSVEFYFNGYFTLDYADVNGDGRPEILLGTETSGVRLHYPELSILDLTGKELARESRNCEFKGSGDEDDLCPIVASEFFFGSGPTRQNSNYRGSRLRGRL
jgi:hypothetical protein